MATVEPTVLTTPKSVISVNYNFVENLLCIGYLQNAWCKNKIQCRKKNFVTQK